VGLLVYVLIGGVDGICVIGGVDGICVPFFSRGGACASLGGSEALGVWCDSRMWARQLHEGVNTGGVGYCVGQGGYLPCCAARMVV
jgi:hypothetical protein